jgi:hypothetical protein
VEPGPGVFDHDLDSLPPRSGAPGRDSIALYQRLVVNPFPAVLVFVIIVAIARTGFATRSVGLFTLGVGLSLVDLFLFKYHCLDCRATGWLLRYRRHVCPGVIARWNRGELPRFCGPGVKIQLAGWLILLASVSVLGLIMLLSA